MPEREQVIAYLQECGQTANDVEWVREMLASKHTELHQIAIEHMYRTGLDALAIIRGDVRGKPDILSKIKGAA